MDDVVGYGADLLPFDLSDPKEGELRSPQLWLKDVHCPTHVLEGTNQPSNIQPLKTLKARCTNPLITFTLITGKTHFSVMLPLVEKISRAIAADKKTTEPFKLE